MNERDQDQSGDPVVDEFRAIRARYWKQAGESGAGYLRLMRELAEKREAAKRDEVGKHRKSA